MSNFRSLAVALTAQALLLAQSPTPPSEAKPQAQPTQMPAVPGGSAHASAPERPAPDGFSTFNSYGTAEAELFRVGYFGMPLVVGAYSSGQKELHVIRGSSLSIFEPEGLGFKLIKTRNLPSPPKDSAYDYLEDKVVSTSGSGGAWSPDKMFEVERNSHADVGYQIGEGGDLFWVASNALFKHGVEGWKVVWAFPKDLSTRRQHPSVQAGLVILTDNRVALLGGKDAFIQILQLGDEPTSVPKVLSAISYETLGCTPSSYPVRSGPQFCVSGGNLYFYLNMTGRLFRLNLDSYSITDYEVPWISEEFGATFLPRKWRNATKGGGANPILPESLAFTPSPDGTVHVAALMYNMPMAVIHTFDLGPEGSSVKSEIKVGTELPKPLTMRDAKGDLVPFPAPTPQEREIARPTRTATEAATHH